MTRRSLLGIVWALYFVSSSTVTACGSEAEEPSRPELALLPLPPSPIAGCQSEAYEYCDIRKTKCQKQVFSLVACLRGRSDESTPPVRVISEDAYRAELLERWVDAQVPSPNHYENALVLLGLVQPGALSQESQVDLDVEYVAAYYDPETKGVSVIDHGGELDNFSTVPILAHEFVHAQQDAELNLNAFADAYKANWDQYLAVRAVVEGEATVYEAQVAAALGGLELSELDLDQVFIERADATMTWLVTQPSPYAVRWSAFPYGTGALYAYLAWRDGGAEGLRVAFADPPQSTQRMLASRTQIEPEVASVENIAAPQISILEDAPGITEQAEEVDNTVLGALGVQMFVAQTDAAGAASVALNWRGDRLWVYSVGPETGLVWKLAFADSRSASAFVAATQQQCDLNTVACQVTAEAERVTWVASTDTVHLNDLISVMDVEMPASETPSE